MSGGRRRARALSASLPASCRTRRAAAWVGLGRKWARGKAERHLGREARARAPEDWSFRPWAAARLLPASILSSQARFSLTVGGSTAAARFAAPARTPPQALFFIRR